MENQKFVQIAGTENQKTAKFCIKCGQSMNIEAEKFVKLETAEEWYEKGEDLIENWNFKKLLPASIKSLK